MQLPLASEENAHRVIDDLLAIKVVLRKAKGDLFAELEISGVPLEVRLGQEETPIFHFGDVAYCLHGDGSVSESRIVKRRYIAYRLYAADGRVLRFELVRRQAAGPDLASILERVVQRGDPDLN